MDQLLDATAKRGLQRLKAPSRNVWNSPPGPVLSQELALLQTMGFAAKPSASIEMRHGTLEVLARLLPDVMEAESSGAALPRLTLAT